MPEFESNLMALDARVAEAQKSVDALNKTLRRLRNAVRAGQVAELEKGLAAVAQRAKEAEEAAQALPDTWTFDARAYLEHGYLGELREAAENAGVNLIERDGRLYSFPLLLRVDAREVAVRVGKRVERRIRPKELIKHLAAMQKRPQRFREQQFLDRLYRVYDRVAGADWQRQPSGPGPVISLAMLHDILTLMLPSSEYPIEEFGRDLLLLARKPDLRTHGCSFDFAGSTMSKERIQRITVYDEQGRERTFIAVRFIKE